MSPDLDIALTHLRTRVRHTVVSILGVATGVGFSIAMAALMEGSQRDFIAKIIDSTPHVVVKDDFRHPPPQPVRTAYADGATAVALRGLKPKEELRGIRNARARVATLRVMTGLTVSPVLAGQAVVRYGGRDVAISVVGMEPEVERQVSRLDKDMVAGSIDALHGTANGLVVGSGLVRRLGADLGATVTVASPTGRLFKMKLVGIFHSGIVAKDDGIAYALLKKVQVLQDRPNVINEIRIRVDNVNAAYPLARRIESRLGYRTESWDEANESILEAFQVRNTIMYTVVGAILLVAGFGIFNVVSTITFEKGRDIAILRALGFEAGDVRAIFVIEGLVLGVLGSLVGAALGYVLCQILATVEFEIKWATELTHLPLYSTPLHYGIAAGSAIIAATVAGYLPAQRAARLDPVEIIRGAA